MKQSLITNYDIIATYRDCHTELKEQATTLGEAIDKARSLCMILSDAKNIQIKQNDKTLWRYDYE